MYPGQFRAGKGAADDELSRWGLAPVRAAQPGSLLDSLNRGSSTRRLTGKGLMHVSGHVVAMLLGRRPSSIHSRLRHDAPLVRCGLVQIDEDDGEVDVPRWLHRLANEPGNNTEDIMRLLFNPASDSELEWDDFNHVARHRDHIETLLSIEQHEDGSLTVRFKAGGISEMCWHLVTWGDSVKVVKPARLRRHLSRMCEELAIHHRDS